MTTKLLIGATLGIGALVLYARKKQTDVVKIYEGLEFSLSRINSFRIDGSKLHLNVNLVLKNNTNYSFSAATGGLITITNLKILTQKGDLLVEAQQRIDNISIEPNSEAIIPNLDLIVDMPSSLAFYAMNLLSGGNTDFTTQTEIEVFGNNYTV